MLSGFIHDDQLIVYLLLQHPVAGELDPVFHLSGINFLLAFSVHLELLSGFKVLESKCSVLREVYFLFAHKMEDDDFIAGCFQT